MLALVKEQPGEGISIHDVAIPTCNDNEVLIKVDSVGICGSDIPILNGVRTVPYPFIPGHEFAGSIVDLGNDVTSWQNGDRVTSSVVQNCLKCEFCRNGLEELCDELLETGIHVNGAFAEYVKVPDNTLHKIPDGMSFLEAASIDPLASAYHVVNKINIDVNDNVAIIGPGPIGLLSLQLAKLKGANKVVMIGTREERLQIAEELGADVIINNKNNENLYQLVHDKTDGFYPNKIIEASGNSLAINEGISILEKNGVLALEGIYSDSTFVNFIDIVRKELKITGSIGYTYNEFAICMDLLNEKKIKIDPIISHELLLSEAEHALDLLNNGKALKVILHP